ncbi:replication protein A 70 kDa DNA-binding subunit B-like [Rutidosis leptorrhynchoides]|uniref:replication protein A 70 kDa DNA-binding subunit B-like n=1 Tax=Rutidosis leptorrhynchoides TaxID=125765 RepID=UPI003A991FAA
MLLVKAISPRYPTVTTMLRILSIETLSKSNFDQGKPFHDVIATDNEGDRIGITLKNYHKNKFEDILKEQNYYVLKNVGTQRFTNNKLNHLTHDIRLIFINKTTVVPVPSNQRTGSDGFRFIPFEDLISCQLPEKHTADVIGKVHYYDREPKTYGSTSDEKSKYINLELKDIDGSIVSCTLFAKYMVDFFAHMKQTDENQCIILLIQFGRTKKYNPQLTVGSDWSHTRLFFDTNLPIITDFRTRFLANHEENGAETSFAPSLTPTLTPKGKPLDEWFENVTCVGCADLSYNNEGVYVVTADIIAIEPDSMWSYIACKKCHRTAKSKSNDVDLTLDIDQQLMLKCNCSYCGDNPQVALRFTVSVRVSDDTGVATVTIFETVVKKFVTKSAYELQKSLPEDEDHPSELEALLGQNLLLKVDVKPYNKKYTLENYTVKDASTDETFFEKFREQYRALFGGVTYNIFRKTAKRHNREIELQDQRIEELEKEVQFLKDLLWEHFKTQPPSPKKN